MWPTKTMPDMVKTAGKETKHQGWYQPQELRPTPPLELETSPLDGPTRPRPARVVRPMRMWLSTCARPLLPTKPWPSLDPAGSQAPDTQTIPSPTPLEPWSPEPLALNIRVITSNAETLKGQQPDKNPFQSLSLDHYLRRLLSAYSTYPLFCIFNEFIYNMWLVCL